MPWWRWGRDWSLSGQAAAVGGPRRTGSPDDVVRAAPFVVELCVSECKREAGRERRPLPDRFWINMEARSEHLNGSSMALRATV